MILSMFVVVALVGLSLYCVSLAVAALPTLKRLRATQMRAVRDLVEGPVEVTGTIRATEATFLSPKARAAVLAAVDVKVAKQQGKSSTTLHSNVEHRKMPANLVDDDGAVVSLDFDHVEIVSPEEIARSQPDQMPSQMRYWLASCQASTLASANTVVCREHTILDGERVTVRATARVVSSTVERAEVEEYRGAAPTERKTFVLEGSLDNKLVIAAGSRSELMFSATWPLVMLFACAATALAFAGFLLRVGEFDDQDTVFRVVAG